MDYEKLVDIIHTYGIAVDPGAVKSAFTDNEQTSGLADWAKLNLTPDTLLSRNEYEQYAALVKAGRVDQLASPADMSSVPALSDEELRTAISTLNHSTEAVAKQTEALKLQQDALSRLVKSSEKNRDGREDMELKQAQKWDTERKAAAAALEELSQNLDFKISELEQQGRGTGVDISQIVDGVLRSDDKLLASLQKLGYELETDDPEEGENVSKLREICARLIKYTVEAIRTKLDRLYLEALESARRASSVERASDDDVHVVQEEVESLYSEILPVAQMSVEQQLLEPALSSVSRESKKSAARSQQAFEYIHACLDYLLDRVERLSSKIEAFHAHQEATSTLVGVAKAELAVPLDPTPPKRERRPTNPSSPTTRRRKSSGQTSATSPVRIRAAPGRRRSSGAGQSDEAPLDQLLRGLALALPQSDEASSAVADGSQTKAQIAALEATVAERTEKAVEVAHNVHESFESSATIQLADARMAIHLVRDSVLAESPFGKVQLLDPETEASIAVLVQEVQKVQARLDAAEADLAKTKGRSAKRDELIRQWGR